MGEGRETKGKWKEGVYDRCTYICDYFSLRDEGRCEMNNEKTRRKKKRKKGWRLGYLELDYIIYNMHL